eukprot:Gb_41384 [translate_table: standard]
MCEVSSKEKHLMSRKISLEELRKHNKRADPWLEIRGKVYNATEWVDKHPGGELPLINMAGQDGAILLTDLWREGGKRGQCYCCGYFIYQKKIKCYASFGKSFRHYWRISATYKRLATGSQRFIVGHILLRPSEEECRGLSEPFVAAENGAICRCRK